MTAIELMTAIETTQAGLWLRDFRAIWAGVAPAVCRSLAAGPSQVAGHAKVAVRLGCDMPWTPDSPSNAGRSLTSSPPTTQQKVSSPSAANGLRLSRGANQLAGGLIQGAPTAHGLGRTQACSARALEDLKRAFMLRRRPTGRHDGGRNEMRMRPTRGSAELVMPQARPAIAVQRSIAILDVSR